MWWFFFSIGTQWRKDQEQDLKNILKNTDQDIPLVFVSGNHDIGNTPTRETIDNYCKSWGDDYFSFWVGGVFFLVLNSQLYFDSSKCPELKQAQDAWLNGQLAAAKKHKCKHVIVFQHIPLFLREPDEDHDYFNLEKSVRQEIMEKFHKAGNFLSAPFSEFLLPIVSGYSARKKTNKQANKQKNLHGTVFKKFGVLFIRLIPLRSKLSTKP